jgi:hypothetical protein
MKTQVIDTVNTLLQRSGQSYPVKNMSTDKYSVQVYDVEHWPDVFNSLLVHDFPAIVISFDTSTASLSGFTVTLQWKPVLDSSAWVGAVVNILVMITCLTMLVFAIFSSMQNVSKEEIEKVQEVCLQGRNSSTGETPTSLLTEHLRNIMVNNDI